MCESMDISSSLGKEDRISQLPDEILFHYLSLLEMKNATQTSTLSKRWRYLWTHSTVLDFDQKEMYPEEFRMSNHYKFETHKYFACVNQVVSMHQGPSIDKFRVRFKYVSSFATKLDEWVKFALSKRVKELVLDLFVADFFCDDDLRKGYSFGFDLLRHPPCYSGVTSLQSLHLCNVNVSQEFLEFLLSHCLHLERLYLYTFKLSSVKVKTSKLKYLTIVTQKCGLEEVEIDAHNLLYFGFSDGYNKAYQGGPRMVFNNLPMLVETNFGGGLCRYPFLVFQKLSLFSTQLCKLSIDLGLELMRRDALFIPDGVIPTFPNVKHFTCAVLCIPNACILSMRRFIEACPMLEELKLRVNYLNPQDSEEASELQEIDLEDEKKIVETEIDSNYDHNILEKIAEASEAEVVKMNEDKQSHSNLRILELVGFLGVQADVQLALAVVSYACSLKTIICETRSNTYAGVPSEYDVEMRARKLAQIVAPKVKVVTMQSDIEFAI